MELSLRLAARWNIDTVLVVQKMLGVYLITLEVTCGCL